MWCTHMFTQKLCTKKHCKGTAKAKAKAEAGAEASLWPRVLAATLMPVRGPLSFLLLPRAVVLSPENPRHTQDHAASESSREEGEHERRLG